MAETVMVTPWPLGDPDEQETGPHRAEAHQGEGAASCRPLSPICPRPTRSLSCGYHPSPASPGSLYRTTGILLAHFHHSLILFLPFLCVECVPTLSQVLLLGRHPRLNFWVVQNGTSALRSHEYDKW